jgi:phage terminase small subunit
VAKGTTKARRLNAAQRLFAHALARPGISQAAAYREAYPNASQRTSEVESTRLLKNPAVAALVEGLRSKQVAQLDETAQEVLDELRHVGMARLSRVLVSQPDGTVKIRPLTEWTEHELAALSEVDVEALFEWDGVERTHVGSTVRLRMKGKQAALETLAKHHKLVTDTVDHKHSGTVYVVDPYGAPPAEGGE